jgi:hypothetical protein
VDATKVPADQDPVLVVESQGSDRARRGDLPRERTGRPAGAAEKHGSLLGSDGEASGGRDREAERAPAAPLIVGVVHLQTAAPFEDDRLGFAKRDRGEIRPEALEREQT